MSQDKKLKVVASLKVKDVPAGNATPGTAGLGAALGQKRIDSRKFCKDFNDLTADYKGQNLNIKVKVMEDGNYKILFRLASASKLILNLLNSQREKENQSVGTKFEKITGSKNPGLNIIGKISRESLMELAKEKMKEMNTLSVESAFKTLAGTAQSIGILLY